MGDRGFVTVATGSDEYYQLAVNLYISYKKNGGKYPFVLICDRENEYSRIFDRVVLVNEFRKSTIDKPLMYHSPYDESIFLDADILILRSIDDLWDVFRNWDDVGIFGCTYPVDSQRGWFTYEGCGEYKPQIKFMIDMNGGIVYFRKTNRASSIFNKALYLTEHYSEFDFKRFKEPADEPVMALSMALHSCKPLDYQYNQLILPGMPEKVTTDYQGNIFIGKKELTPNLIHFSNIRTKHFLYNYLSFIAQNGNEAATQKNYYRMKRKYLFVDGKFNLFHNVGAVLRGMGLDSTVEKIKLILK